MALANRAATLTAVGLLFVASLCLLPFIGREFFPQVDSGQLTIFARCPTGTRLAETNRRVGKFDAEPSRGAMTRAVGGADAVP